MKLTWREKTTIRILLLVAKLVSGNREMAEEIQVVANHISAGLGEDK